MSYILDALQKSEQERHRGSVPNLQSVQISTGTPAGKRRIWLPVISVLLISGVAIFGYRLQLQNTETRSNITPPLLQKPPATAADPVVKKQLMAPSPPVSRQKNPQPVVAEKADRMARLAEKAATTQFRAVQKASAPETAVPASGVPDTLPESPAPQWQKITPSSANPVAVVKEVQPAEQQAEAVAAPRPLLPTLSELPKTVQNRLPAIRISAHIYSGKPSSRMVIINTKTLREGQDVGGGLILQEITRAGVIFQFEGSRFRMSKLKVWRRN